MISDFIDSSHFMPRFKSPRRAFNGGQRAHFCTWTIFFSNVKLKRGSGGKRVKRGSAQHCGHHHHRRQRAHTRRHLNCLSTTLSSSNFPSPLADTRLDSDCRCGRACRRGCCPSWSAFDLAQDRFGCDQEASRWSRFVGCRWRFSRATFERRRRSACPLRASLLDVSEMEGICD